MNKQKQDLLFDPEQVSINIILEPNLRYVEDPNGVKYQTEYIINYQNNKYVPLFALDTEDKLTGEGTVYKLTMTEDSLELTPILNEGEWNLAQELLFFVEDNSHIIEAQIKKQREVE